MTISPMTRRASGRRGAGPSGQADHPGAGQVTVVSVPGATPYVRHIASRADDGVRRLPVPDATSPVGPGQPGEAPWPPRAMTLDWVTTNEFDVLHLHLGFDPRPPEELAAVVDAVQASGRRFVLTVHDLRSAHPGSAELHEAQLATLLARADDVITLTPGAAAVIERRWGRHSVVLPHPHVVDLPTMRALQVTRTRYQRRRSTSFRVGLHLDSLRPSVDATVLLRTLLDVVEEIPAGTVQVNGHREVLHPRGARHQPDLARFLREADARDRLELHVDDRPTEQDLWTYLFALDTSVIADVSGTHSEWLEACRDLGTAVVAPTCGFYAEQGSVHSYVMDERHFDAQSLRRAVLEAFAAAPARPVSVEDRVRERDEVAAAHREVYFRGTS